MTNKKSLLLFRIYLGILEEN